MTASTHTSTSSDYAADDLIGRAVFLDRPEFAAVRVRGDDRLSWLNGQVTNDVRHITPGKSVHALCVNVRGKILSDVWVTDIGEALLLLVAASTQAQLLESLERFIIMEDVTLEPWPEAHVLSLEGPSSENLHRAVQAPGVHGLPFDPLGVGGYAWVGAENELEGIKVQLRPHASAISPMQYELARLRRAQPRFSIDYDEHHYPQEAGLKALVSFQKGCYLGQEVVCTLENRGRLNRFLCALHTSSEVAIETGATLTLTSEAHDSVGSVTSSVWDPTRRVTLVLGYVKRAHATIGAQLLAGGQTLTLDKHVGDADAT
jgi:folate-binding protein YgfZ